MLDESHGVACLVIACLVIDNYLAVAPGVTAHTSPDGCTRLYLVEGGIDMLLDTRQMKVGGGAAAVGWGWDIRRTGGVRIAVFLVDFAHD